MKQLSPDEDLHNVIQTIPRHIYNNFPSLLQFFTGPISFSVISDLHHISLQYWNQKLISCFKSRGSGFKNLRPHKSLALMLLHIIQFGSQVITYDLCSLGTALLLCNSFLLNKQWERDKLQLHKIPQASSWVAAVKNAANRHQLLSSPPPTSFQWL